MLVLERMVPEGVDGRDVWQNYKKYMISNRTEIWDTKIGFDNPRRTRRGLNCWEFTPHSMAAYILPHRR